MKRIQTLYKVARHEVHYCIGATGAVGVALCMIGLAAAALPVSGWRLDTLRLKAERLTLAAAVERDNRSLSTTPNLDEQLKNFNAWFPGMKRNAGDLRIVVEQAARAGVELDKGEYRVATNSGIGFVNYEVLLPVRADYAGIRHFISGVLDAMPYASLAEIRMERPAVNSTALDARVHFTMVYRGE